MLKAVLLLLTLGMVSGQHAMDTEKQYEVITNPGMDCLEPVKEKTIPYPGRAVEVWRSLCETYCVKSKACTLYVFDENKFRCRLMEKCNRFTEENAELDISTVMVSYLHWSEWSKWSDCYSHNRGRRQQCYKKRTRNCLTEQNIVANTCDGQYKQRTRCAKEDCDNARREPEIFRGGICGRHYSPGRMIGPNLDWKTVTNLPWAVELLSRVARRSSKCLGAVVNHEWILAVDCSIRSRNIHDWLIEFGEGKEAQVDVVHNLPKGLQLVKLAGVHSFSDNMVPVCYPKYLPTLDQNCFVSGLKDTAASKSENSGEEAVDDDEGYDDDVEEEIKELLDKRWKGKDDNLLIKTAVKLKPCADLRDRDHVCFGESLDQELETPSLLFCRSESNQNWYLVGVKYEKEEGSSTGPNHQFLALASPKLFESVKEGLMETIKKTFDDLADQ